MKITKTASGKSKVKMSKKEWQDIGKKAGWKEDFVPTHNVDLFKNPELLPPHIQGILDKFSTKYDEC